MTLEFVTTEPGDDPIIVEGYIAATPARLFRAWTDPNIVTQWLAALHISCARRLSISAQGALGSSWNHGTQRSLSGSRANILTLNLVSVSYSRGPRSSFTQPENAKSHLPHRLRSFLWRKVKEPRSALFILVYTAKTCVGPSAADGRPPSTR